MVLMRRQEDSGQRQLSEDIIALRAASFYSHMNSLGVSPEKYTEVYEAAVRIYNEQEIKGPFGVDHMIQAVRRMQEVSKEYVIYKRPEGKLLGSCSRCQGSKISYNWMYDKVVGINRNPDGTVKKCEECGE